AFPNPLLFLSSRRGRAPRVTPETGININVRDPHSSSVQHALNWHRLQALPASNHRRQLVLLIQHQLVVLMKQRQLVLMIQHQLVVLMKQRQLVLMIQHQLALMIQHQLVLMIQHQLLLMMQRQLV
ncbi:unnamed protein product, partial [Ectocarpus sp. 12 AP-2014]